MTDRLGSNVGFRQDAAVASAWQRSFLGSIEFDGTSLNTLFSDAMHATLAPGQLVQLGRTGWTEAPTVYLVVQGMFRAYISHPNGRQTTVQYMRVGDFWGIILLLTADTDPIHRMTYQTLEQSRVVGLNGEKFAALVKSKSEATWALAREAAMLVGIRTRALSSSTFSTISERVAQHICTLAVQEGQGIFAIYTSQQELADAVGTVREVVTRVIAQFKSDGLVRYAGRRLEILDMRGLQAMGPTDGY